MDIMAEAAKWPMLNFTFKNGYKDGLKRPEDFLDVCVLSVTTCKKKLAFTH